MPDTKMPRSGSMQFWPRKRSRRAVARVRSWAKLDKPQIMGFAGYKVGMTNIIANDTRKKNPKIKSSTKLSIPVTVLECPPLKIASVRLYKTDEEGNCIVAKEILGKADKELARKLTLPKSSKESELANIKPEDFDEVRVNVYTQPKLAGVGKKKPEFFEVAVGGPKEDAINYAKENLGKEISASDIFSDGMLVDFHVITKGKGFQGSVKRFGIGLTSHKSEKKRRGPGSLGGWKGQGHFMYRVPNAGKMGYHMRTEYNKQIVHMGDDASQVNASGGFPGYGVLKTNFILIKGSVGGARKRLVRFNHPVRKPAKAKETAPAMTHISTESKQGR